jgi:hypothetical protein
MYAAVTGDGGELGEHNAFLSQPSEAEQLAAVAMLAGAGADLAALGLPTGDASFEQAQEGGEAPHQLSTEYAEASQMDAEQQASESLPAEQQEGEADVGEAPAQQGPQDEESATDEAYRNGEAPAWVEADETAEVSIALALRRDAGADNFRQPAQPARQWSAAAGWAGNQQHQTHTQHAAVDRVSMQDYDYSCVAVLV